MAVRISVHSEFNGASLCLIIRDSRKVAFYVMLESGRAEAWESYTMHTSSYAMARNSANGEFNGANLC